MTNLKLLTALALVAATLSAEQTAAAYKQEITAGAEEIFVFRTSRTEATPGATAFCTPAPFASIREDFYALASMELNTKTSKVSNTHVRAVGGFRACFTGFSPLVAGQARTLEMFAKGETAGISWTGQGGCVVMAAQPPVRTVLALNCQLALTGLPDVYAGGLLVSSTAAPVLGANAPADAHVPGYLSTSVVTMRLWKKVAEK
jgi:hypothetical protein